MLRLGKVFHCSTSVSSFTQWVISVFTGTLAIHLSLHLHLLTLSLVNWLPQPSWDHKTCHLVISAGCLCLSHHHDDIMPQLSCKWKTCGAVPDLQSCSLKSWVHLQTNLLHSVIVARANGYSENDSLQSQWLIRLAHARCLLLLPPSMTSYMNMSGFLLTESMVQYYHKIVPHPLHLEDK